MNVSLTPGAAWDSRRAWRLRRLRFAPAARSDLQELAGYIAVRAGIAVAAEVRSPQACRRQAHNGSVRPEIAAGIRSFPVPPFVLFFRYGDAEVQVARILHERQDIEEVFRSDD